jgi:hypothetical protein
VKLSGRINQMKMNPVVFKMPIYPILFSRVASLLPKHILRSSSAEFSSLEALEL